MSIEDQLRQQQQKRPDFFPPSPNYTGWSPGLLALRDGGAGDGSGEDARAEFTIPAPSGGVHDNALSVFGDIRREILVRTKSN